MLAVGEVLPEIAAQPALLADRCDGQPLPTGTGPWQVILPGDQKTTRWVRQVVRVAVIEVKP